MPEKRLGLHDQYVLRGTTATVLQTVAANGLQLLWRREADWRLNPRDLLGSFKEEVHELLDDFIFADESLLKTRRHLTYKSKKLAMTAPTEHEAYKLAQAEAAAAAIESIASHITAPNELLDQLMVKVEENNNGAEFDVTPPSEWVEEPTPGRFQPAWPQPKDEPKEPEGWGQW
jgi:hypothetical protein